MTRFAALALALLVLFRAERCIAQAPATMQADAPRVFIVTIGPGAEVWEKFGHNMLWIHDPRARAGDPDAAYNWGMFDFGPGFPFQFLAGSLEYWIDMYPDAGGLVQLYVDDDRTVIVQELNLLPEQIDTLIADVERNRLPQNKRYAYDYYLDNCSTRVRDAIDSVIGGEIRRQLEPRPTGTTYRWHTRRLMADNWITDLAIAYIEGAYVERGIDQWQESFLPVKFMERLRSVTVAGKPLVSSERTLHVSRTYTERSAPPGRFLPYLLLGVVVGAALVFVAGVRNRWVRRGAWLGAMAWCVFGGGGSVILLYTWFFTRHIPPKWNQNLWQVNPLLLALLVMIPLLRRPKVARAAVIVALAIVALDLIGIAIKVLPIAHQANSDLIALALTINAGLAAALYRATKAKHTTEAPIAGAKSAKRPIRVKS